MLGLQEFLELKPVTEGVLTRPRPRRLDGCLPRSRVL
jgi:hypothetical protein